jgi:hypothetical protein
MPNYSATWVSLHNKLSYAKKNLSVAEREIYIVARFNFHLLKAMQLGQSFGTWMLCKLTCEEV